MSSVMDTVTVAGVEIDIIRETGAIPLRVATDALGVGYEAQRQRLRLSHWATTWKFQVVAEDGKMRDQVVMDRKTMIMWAATLPVSKIKDPEIKDRVMAFQLEVVSALDAYFFKGIAINPRFPHAVEATEANEGYTLAQAARHLGFGLHAFTGALRAMDVIRKGSDGHHYPAPSFERWFDVATTNALRVTEDGMDALQQIAKSM